MQTIRRSTACPVPVFANRDSERPTDGAGSNCFQRFRRRAEAIAFERFLTISIPFLPVLHLTGGPKKKPAIQADARMAGKHASHLGNQTSQNAMLRNLFPDSPLWLVVNALVASAHELLNVLAKRLFGPVSIGQLLSHRGNRLADIPARSFSGI